MSKPCLGFLPFEPLMQMALTASITSGTARLPVLDRTSRPDGGYVNHKQHVGWVRHTVGTANGRDGAQMGTDDAISRVARELGTTQRTVHRYIHDGVPVRTADQLCAAMNLNPVEVWGGGWWEPVDDTPLWSDATMDNVKSSV